MTGFLLTPPQARSALRIPMFRGPAAGTSASEGVGSGTDFYNIGIRPATPAGAAASNVQAVLYLS